MSALQQDPFASELRQLFRRLDVGITAGDVPAEQPFRFRDVRRDDGRERDEVAAQRFDRGAEEERIAVLRDEHGVADEVADLEVPDGLCHRPNDRFAREHPGLRCVDTDVGDDGGDLLPDEVGTDLEHTVDTDRVLSGQCRKRRHAVDTEHRERLEVGLDPSAAAGVGSRDRQRARNLHRSVRKWS